VKKMALALSAVTGLAAAILVLASPASAAPSAVGAAPLRPCMVIDVAAPGASHVGDHAPVKQVVPSPCT
jgi:hypothetical protein